ncbi:MAG: type II toxin-antitoxin system VapC family toxin [Cyanobacteria bacterium]|nr:type II toxin-antitoxin system VapC family toxin [Cyanobacteriota bacterium]
MAGYREIEEQINNDIFIVSDKTWHLFNLKEKIILDTSVIIKWFFEEDEENVKTANLILNKYHNNEIQIIAPEIALFEISNVIKNRINNLEDKNTGAEIIDKIFNLGIIFYVTKEILKNAFNIAIDINESVYDCIFIAVAEHFKSKFITDDKKLLLNYSNFKANSENKIQIVLLENYL